MLGRVGELTPWGGDGGDSYGFASPNCDPGRDKVRASGCRLRFESSFLALHERTLFGGGSSQNGGPSEGVYFWLSWALDGCPGPFSLHDTPPAATKYINEHVCILSAHNFAVTWPFALKLRG